MTNGIALETNEIAHGTNGDALLPCWHCGGEAAIALHSNEFGEYWWSVQRGHDDATACKCRLFMESDRKFSLEDGEKPEDSPWAMELRARLVEKWNTRVAVTDNDFAMAFHDGELWGKCSECKERQGYYLDAETIQSQQEHIAELERERDEWRLKCCEEAGLHASHVFQRDELIRDLYENLWTHKPKCAEAFAERMRELGIEVN